MATGTFRTATIRRTLWILQNTRRPTFRTITSCGMNETEGRSKVALLELAWTSTI